MKRLLLDGKELMYAEARARVVAEAKPWVLSMQHAPILRLAFIRELAGIARLQAEDIERQYGLAQPVTSRPFPDGGWQKGRSGFNRRGDGRFSNWSPRPAPEPRVRVKDVRERMLQCFLSYPHLVQVRILRQAASLRCGGLLRQKMRRAAMSIPPLFS